MKVVLLALLQPLVMLGMGIRSDLEILSVKAVLLTLI